MVEIRTDELQRAETRIREDENNLHIYGEPGVGKSKFLEHLQKRLEKDFSVIEQTVRLHHDQSDVIRNILHDARQEAPRRDNLPNKITGASGGIGGISVGATTDERASDLHKLESLTDGWSGDPLIICIDDIHKLSEDNHIVRDTIKEIATKLRKNSYLITVGQISLLDKNNIESIQLDLFTYEESKTFLETKFGKIEEDTVKAVHNSVEGHPLYLDLLTEASDNESDLHLPEDKVFDTIQHRYVKTLPAETEEFLRKVAPLPELNEKKIHGVLSDYSPTEIDRHLRDLNRQVIVQEVNRTKQGSKVYKIHEIFREYLIRKQTDIENIHRTSFEYHIEEMTNILTSNDEEALEHSLPHSFSARYHLDQLYEEVDSKALYREFEELEIEYPKRGILMAVCGLFVVPLDALELFKLEHENFSDWILDQTEEHPLARLTVQITEWGLSQFEEESIDLSEIRIEGDLDDIPTESQPFTEVELSERHAEHLMKSVKKLLAYFFIDEPFQSESFRHQFEKQMGIYGISIDVLTELKEKIKSILQESELSEEFESAFEQNIQSVDEELNSQLISNIDFYELSDISLRFGQDIFDEVHEDILIESGILTRISIEGGEVLEDAENPAYPLLWYSLWITYFRDQPIEDSKFDRLLDSFHTILSNRREFEQGLEEPILSADDVSDNVEIPKEN